MKSIFMTFSFLPRDCFQERCVAHLHVAIVADVIAPHQLVAIALEEEHFSVEGGWEEGERVAAAVVHSENREMICPVSAGKVGEFGANPGQNLPPCLRGFMKGEREVMIIYPAK